MAKKVDQKPTFNIAYSSEFAAEQISELKLTDIEGEDAVALLTLTDEEVGNLKNSDFAIVQKTEEGINRRFPIHNEVSVKAAAVLLDSAKDLTPSEVIKAKATIEKAAKKLGITVEFKSETEVKPAIEDAEINKDVKVDPDTEKTLEEIVAELKNAIKSIEASKLQDSETDIQDPIVTVLGELVTLTDSEDSKLNLLDAITSVLEPKGLAIASKELIETAETQATTITSLNDELADAKDEIELLDELNRDLNVQIRKSKVDEIADSKQSLGLIKDSIEEEKERLGKLSYDVLAALAVEHRELKTKLTDSSVNNKQDKEISTVKDPTLTDSEVDSTEPPKLEDGEKELSKEEVVKLFRTLFRF